MRPRILISLILLIPFCSYSQSEGLEFDILRQYDDLSALEDSTFECGYCKFKRFKTGESSTLSFGGSYRTQIEGFINQNFDNSVDQNDYWSLNRFMLHADYRLGDKLQVFGELNSSLIYGKEDLAPVDKDELSVNQLFIRYRITEESSLSVGRENDRLGSGRLIDIREGPNVRLSFDKVEYTHQGEGLGLRVFAGVPVQIQEGVFDNDFLNFDEYIAGFYATKQLKKSHAIDGYFIWKTEKTKTWEAGTADDQRGSFGIRHFGQWKGFHFNNESVVQVGNFGSRRILAWTLSFNIERHWTTDAGSFNYGLKTELISGDDAEAEDVLSTFDALYPRGAYFGRVARFGPSNLFDIHPYINFQKGRFFAEFDYVYFWRFSTTDGLYNPALILEYPSLNDERGIAHQIGTITGFTMNRHFGVEIETNIIFPDGFLVESGLNDTLFHTVLTAEIKF